MFFYRRTIPGLAIHSYLMGDEVTRACVVLDPARDVEEYLEVAEKEGFQIMHIFETHVHADYVCGSKELKASLDGKPQIYCSGMGGKEWTPAYADVVVQDGDKVDVGALSFCVIHTPGHTPEHIMWALDSRFLFTGDFLFVGDVGRPDLLGPAEKEKLAHQLYDSVFQVLPNYSDSTEVFPAHGAGSLCGKAIGSQPSTTLGQERRSNRSLERRTEGEWIDALMDGMPPAPTYFPRMKRVNVIGPKVIGPELPGKRGFKPSEVDKEVLILDVRSKEAFSEAHIPGSINIPFGPALSNWAGWVLSEDKPLLLIIEKTEHLDETIRMLLRVGFDNIVGYLEGGIEGFPKETLDTMTVQDLREKRKGYFVLDVRTDREWNEGHIEGATHIPVGLVMKNLDRLPKDQSIAVVCGSGYRASVVASLLKREGFDQVSNVFGGMTA